MRNDELLLFLLSLSLRVCYGCCRVNPAKNSPMHLVLLSTPKIIAESLNRSSPVALNAILSCLGVKLAQRGV